MIFLYALFVFRPPVLKTNPFLTGWFIVSGAVVTVGLYGFIKYARKFSAVSGWKILEFLLPSLLFLESMIQFLGKPLFRLAYIPVIIIISGNLSYKIVISCILTIFLLSFPTRWWINGYFTQEGIIYLSIVITGVLSYYIFYKKLKTSTKAIEDLTRLKDSAMSLEPSTEATLFDEDRFSSLVKSVIETQKELKDLFNLAKKVIQVDSIILFTLEGEHLVTKASTEDSYFKIASPGEGYLLSVIKGKKPIVRPNLRANLFDIEKKEEGFSLCMPVFNGNVPIGVLEMVSSRKSAFDEREKDIAASFAYQTGEILRKARIYVEVERFAKGFKSLHEASRMLSTSLRIEEIAEQLVELVSGIVSSSAVGFFLPDKGKLRLIAKKGFESEKESFYTKGTYFDLIVKNRQLLHFSYVDKKQGVYPFKMTDIKTFLGLPLLSENDLLGILAVVSKEADAISSFYEHLLKFMAAQAALSITNARLHNEVKKLAITDGLTGLYNHKHFHEKLSVEFQRLERIPQPLSLMIMDLDYFKKINDVYGHPAGDAVLANLAAILRKTLRGIDIIARYGGEEFAAVLINTEMNGARKMAERLRANVMNNTFFVDENRLSITLSIGIATYPDDATTKEELVNRADKALYYAKKSGRNQVCVWKDVEKKI